MAERLLIAGQPQLGLELADRAIAMEDSTSIQPFAWFTRGEALRGLGDNSEALLAFEKSLERQPEGTLAAAVHRSMALVYEQASDPVRASENRGIATEIEQALLPTPTD